jgi:hypothetical protein
MVNMRFDKPCVAIVMFGPATPTSGMRPAEYYQVTIDPAHCSPSGEYIRFGLYKGDEIHGWQRADAMTVVEVLGEGEATDDPSPGEQKEPILKTVKKHEGPLTMRAISG